MVAGFSKCNYKLFAHDRPCILARCRIIAKRIRLFPNLTDLSGRGKSVELEQTPKQTNEQTTRKNTLFTLSRLDMPGDHESEIGKTPW